jgi:hypothetical protein
VSDITKWNNKNSFTNPEENGRINGIYFDLDCGQSWGGDGNTSCETRLASKNISKVDGGYYIYRFNKNNSNCAVTAASKPASCN